MNLISIFFQFLSDYMVSPNQVISRDLDQAIRPQLRFNNRIFLNLKPTRFLVYQNHNLTLCNFFSFLTENGKHSFPLALGNLIRQLKKEINHLSDAVSQEEVLV